MNKRRKTRDPPTRESLEQQGLKTNQQALQNDPQVQKTPQIPSFCQDSRVLLP